MQSKSSIYQGEKNKAYENEMSAFISQISTHVVGNISDNLSIDFTTIGRIISARSQIHDTQNHTKYVFSPCVIYFSVIHIRFL